MESALGMAVIAFTSFFTLINPLGTMPVFMTMTAGLDNHGRKKTAIKAVLVAFGALLFFAFTGQLLFKFFGISVDSFRVVGGIIFFMMGYDMLQARLSSVKVRKEDERSYVTDISVTPLGIPMICGPGTITNMIVLMESADSTAQKATLILTTSGVLALTLLIFIGSSHITEKLGETGNKVLMRMMGLIVMVIAVEFFFSGMRPILARIIQEGMAV
ncbi:MAG: NAAT family transporter [Flavobacteriales bacterium]|nr:NAAT family transporter [Flavobacteriales bacterium]